MTPTNKHSVNRKSAFTAILNLATMVSATLMLFSLYFYYHFYFKWIGRFNSEGRFFDNSDSVVYTDDGDAMIIPVVFFFLMTLGFVTIRLKMRKRNMQTPAK